MSTDTPYYYGSAENKLNAKGQVVIPARFRSVHTDDEQGRNFVVVRGEARCLYMYSHRQFGKIKDNARAIAQDVENSDFFRRFMAEACPVEIDNQGRFVLPQPLMKAVGIAGPAILFIGMDDRVEIWEPSEYASSHGVADEYEDLRRASAKKIFGM